jgi:hypothetical protein
MKQVFIILSLMLSTGLIFAQENTQKKPLVIDLTGGARIGEMPTANDLLYTPSGADLGANFGVRYMLYNLTENTFFGSLGVKLDFGYDQASAEMISGGTTTAQIFRIGGHLILDLNDIYDMGVDGLSINLHGGAGCSYLSNPDGYADKYDRMPNIVFGLTPEYRFHPNIAVIADFSFVGLYKQDCGVEFNEYLSGAPDDKESTSYFNASIGLAFRFGKSYDSVPSMN